MLLGQLCQTSWLLITQLHKVSHYGKSGDGGQMLDERHICSIAQPENQEEKRATNDHPNGERSQEVAELGFQTEVGYHNQQPFRACAIHGLWALHKLG